MRDEALATAERMLGWLPELNERVWMEELDGLMVLGTIMEISGVEGARGGVLYLVVPDDAERFGSAYVPLSWLSPVR